MNSKLILMTVGLTIVIAFAGGLYQYSQKMVRSLEGPENRPPAWSLYKANNKMEESTSLFDEAGALLARYEFGAAHLRATVEAVEPIRDFMKWHPTNTVSDGLTLPAWAAARQKDYETALKQQFTNAIHALKSGGLDPDRIKDAIQIHTNDPFFQQTWERKKPGVLKARLARAGQAIRLRVNGIEDERVLEKIIEDSLLSKMTAASNSFLFIGEPMSEEEAMA
ncbi:MAG: hypothetical protein AAF492_14450, partial [Verrucomicrobiota bacterium]